MMSSLMRKGVAIVAMCVLFAAAGGCKKVSFPREAVIQAVKDMCMKEYKVKVKAKIVGNTFGIYIPMGSLLTSSLGFKEDALEILQDVSTSVRRVCLSTDADFDFFTVIGADRSTNIEFVMNHNNLDLRMVMLGNISRGDYIQRMVLKIRYDMQALAERRIRNFFTDLATARIEKVIGGNFYPGVTLKDISSTFFLSLLELSMKDKIDFKILAIKSLQISPDDVLCYVKARETYVPKEGYAANTFTTPSGYDHEYLFVVTGKEYALGIKRIYLLNSVDRVDKDTITFPKEYEAYQDVSKWDDVNFFVEDMTLPKFLAAQVAQRIKNKVNEAKVMKDKLSLESVDGECVAVGGANAGDGYELVLKVKDKGALKQDLTRAVPAQFYALALRTFKDVCRDYKFKDFKKVSIFDADNKLLFSMDKSMMKTP